MMKGVKVCAEVGIGCGSWWFFERLRGFGVVEEKGRRFGKEVIEPYICPPLLKFTPNSLSLISGIVRCRV
jgi:hypothetical protein